MRIHHLNCGSMCPFGGKRLIEGEGSWLSAAHLCCHCLLIESRQGLILVDTGLGRQDIAQPRRLGRAFLAMTRPRLSLAETAWQQIRDLGLKPADVRHILVTHLDLDHAGGLADFPQARVHVYADELSAALNRATLAERGRYIRAQWAHQPQWVPRKPTGEQWLGMQAVQALDGTDDEVLLVPLVGHTRGHCGIAVKSPTGWLLHAGDAYFHHGDLETPPAGSLGLRVFQHLVQFNRRQRLANQVRLRELVARTPASELEVFCAHDASELARMQARSATGSRPQ